MVHIVTNTGEDSDNRSRGSKGYVFVHDSHTGRESYIFFAAELIDEETWVGQWRQQVYNVPDGAIIKLIGGWTFHGRPHDYAGAYFIVREGTPIIKASCRARGEQKGYIIGPLETVEYKDIEPKLKIKIHPQYKKYYRNKGIVIETTEQSLQGERS